MRLRGVKIIVLLFIAVFFTGCATSQMSEQEPGRSYAQSTGNELRVGVTPDYPPIIFRQNEAITGVEADLAMKLAKELKRRVYFVILSWEDQIPALLEGRIDIIMSGMSVTKAREIRIAFAEPYLKSGLVAAMRAEDAKKYDSKDSILNGYVTVGAVKDTTGDLFVKRSFPNAVRKAFLPNAKDAINELKRRAIDIFVYDAPTVVWLVSENEANIAGFWEPFTEEYLAWGVRKDDEKFLMDVNAVLQQWKQNGTLNGVLQKWLPAEYLKRIS
jgi:ABC-type amino acid transport substrate-binding protein